MHRSRLVKITDCASVLRCRRGGIRFRWYLHGGLEYREETFRPEWIRMASHGGPLVVTEWAALLRGITGYPYERAG